MAEAKVQDLTTSLKETRDEAAKLRSEVEKLRVVEQKYKHFKEREPEIRHHLQNNAALAK